MPQEYSFEKYWPYEEKFDPSNTSVDVYVAFNGAEERYVGTFTTLSNLKAELVKNKQTGERASGKYTVADNNIVVEEATDDVIGLAIRDLLERKEFHRYFIEAEK